MTRLVITLLTVFILFWVPASYAGGWHHGGYGYHGGYHGGHGYHSSFFISYVPYWGPSYYYPARVIVPTPVPTTIYVEKSEQQQPNYWYYCTDPEGYYPYVKQCPPGWMQVVPSR